MFKKKKGPKKVKVNTSRPHRKKGGWVREYWRRRAAKAYRNKEHFRNARRTKEEIKKKGTRKEEKARKKALKRLKKLEKRKNKQKTKQLSFGPPRKGPAQKSIVKKV